MWAIAQTPMSLVLLFALLFRHFFRVFFFRGIHIVDWYWDKTPKIPSFLDDDPISSGTTKSRHRFNFHQASSRQSLLWVKSFGPATNCEDSPLFGWISRTTKTIAAWRFQPSWKMMDFVSWDDDIPNWMESHKIHGNQTTNQIEITNRTNTNSLIWI